MRPRWGDCVDLVFRVDGWIWFVVAGDFVVGCGLLLVSWVDLLDWWVGCDWVLVVHGWWFGRLLAVSCFREWEGMFTWVLIAWVVADWLVGLG